MGGGYELPIPIIIMFVVYASGLVVFSKTLFGRGPYAFGDNEKSARLSGINTDRIKTTAYIVLGFFGQTPGGVPGKVS